MSHRSIRSPGIVWLLPCYGTDGIAVVTPVVFRRKLFAGKRTDDDRLGVVFQRVVYFIVDLVDHGEIKENRPYRQDRLANARDRRSNIR